jgi:hypothetical protein
MISTLCTISVLFGACVEPHIVAPQVHFVAQHRHIVAHQAVIPLPRPRPVEMAIQELPVELPAASIEPQPVQAAETQQHQEEHMQSNFDAVKAFFIGLSWLDLAALAIICYFIYSKGWPWVLAKAQSIWGTVESDVSQAVSVLKTDMAGLVGRVTNLETTVANTVLPKVGVTPVVPAPQAAAQLTASTPAATIAAAAAASPTAPQAAS